MIENEPVIRSYTPVTSDDDKGYMDLVVKVIVILNPNKIYNINFEKYPFNNYELKILSVERYIRGSLIWISFTKTKLYYWPYT